MEFRSAPTIRPVNDPDLTGYRIERVSERDISLSGDSYVFSRDVVVFAPSGSTVLSNQLGQGISALARWWRIAAPPSFSYVVRCNAPSVIAHQGGQEVSGLSTFTEDLLELSCSHPLNLWIADTPPALRVGTPTVSVPGALDATGTKLANSQGTAGFNVLATILPAPHYTVFRVIPPVGATSTGANSQFMDPLFLAVEDAATGRVFILGDVAGFMGLTPVTFIVTGNMSISGVGVWFPDGEVGTDAPVNKYWGVSVTSYFSERNIIQPFSTGQMTPGGSVGLAAGTSPFSGATRRGSGVLSED
jgi:hypothetical protein